MYSTYDSYNYYLNKFGNSNNFKYDGFIAPYELRCAVISYMKFFKPYFLFKV